MKISKLIILAYAVALNTVFAQEIIAEDSDLEPLEGPYLGQEPPDLTAKVFAPGIISTEHRDHNAFFSPDMKEFYFTRKDIKDDKWSLIVFKYENNQWRESVVGPRVGRPIIAPNGKTMHLGNRYMERTSTGWSVIKSLGPMFEREDWGIMRLSASSKGTYVFDDYKSNDIIRISTLKNGKREAPKKLGPAVNTGKFNAHPFIAPDESYIIWDGERESGFGNSDLYISFQRQDGSWGEAINLGDKINTEAREASAYVTPDAKYLFFNRTVSSRDGDIFWVDAQVIESLRPKNTEHPIAYGSNGICLANSEGTSEVRLTSGDHGYPAWSPDGKRLAFYGYYDGGKTWSIHTINSDGTDEKRLTHVKDKWDNMPSWSPDGSKIVFAREYKDSEGVWHPEIWIMTADGSEQTQIKSISGGGPCFMPDGKLLFHSEYKDKESEISIADIDGGNVIHLTNNEAEEWDAKVSPDGKQIAFTSDRDGNHEVYIMNIDGSGQTRLTNNDVDDYGPSWSADGSQIVYQSKGDGAKKDDKSGLYIMNKDGSLKRRIISEGWQPAWFNSKQ